MSEQTAFKQTALDVIKNRVRRMGDRIEAGEKLMEDAHNLLREIADTGHTFKCIMTNNARECQLSHRSSRGDRAFVSVSYNFDVAGELLIKEGRHSDDVTRVTTQADLNIAIGDLVVKYCREHRIKEL